MNLISDISLEEYKKIKIREVIRTFINEPRFEEMKRQLTCTQKVNKWKKFKDFQQKLDLQQRFNEIQNLQNIDQNDSMLVQLEILMKNKSSQVQNLFNPLPYEHLIHVIYQKKGNVGLQDLKQLTYTSNKTYRMIYEKIIQDRTFINWRQKYFKSQQTPVKLDTIMDIQQPVVQSQAPPRMEIQQPVVQSQTPRIAQNRVKQEIQIDKSSKRPSINNKILPESQYSIESIDNERTKLSKWLSRIKQKYGDIRQDIIQVKLLQHMLNLLQNKQKLKLKYIENIIKNEERWNDDLENLFMQSTHRDQTINFVLIGISGFAQIKKIFEIMVSINIFELEERCELSKFDNVLQYGVFIVGNTGAGKTTLIQSLLGYKLAKQSNSYHNITLTIDGQIRKEHQRLVAGNSIESITTFLTSVQLNYQNKVIHLIDSPGFEDTRGAVTDIANQIMLQNAYEMSRFTAYVILTDLTKLQIDKSQGIKTLVVDIAKRFEYSSLDELKQFVLLIFNNKFDRMSEKDIHNLRVMVKNFQSHQQIISSPKNKIALQLLIQSLYSKDHFFDHSKEQSSTRIKEMIACMNFTRNNKLKTSFENNTKQQLRETVRSIKKIIQRSNEQNNLKKKQFYYDLFYKLNRWIPNEVKKEKNEIDYIFQTQSNKVFQSICEYLDDRLKLKKFDQNQFNTFKSNIQKLRQYKNLSIINPNIKSNKQILEKIQSFQQQYIRKLDHTLTSDQAKNQYQFLTSFPSFQQFQQFQSIFNRIQQSFANQINQIHQTIQKFFVKADYQAYNHSTDVLMNLVNVCNIFKLDVTQQNIRIQQLLSEHQDIIELKYNDLVSATEKCNKQLDQEGNQILQLERNYLEYYKYANFKMLSKNKTKDTIQNQIRRKIQTNLSIISNQFQLFMNFSPHFHKQINKQIGRIQQILKLKNLNINIIKRVALDHFNTIQKCFHKKIRHFSEQLQQILSCLKKNEIIKKHDKNYSMRKRIQTFQQISKYFIQKEMVKSIQQLHSIYCSQLKKKQQQIKDLTSEKSILNKESSITQFVHHLTAFQGYASLDSKDLVLYEKLKQTYKKLIKKNFDQIYNDFSIKFSNLEQLKNKFNKKCIKLLRQRIINTFTPLQPFLAKEELIQCLYEVYCAIANLFSSLEKLIKGQCFQTQQNDEKNNVNDRKRMNIYVETLCYLYEILKKQLSGDNVVTLFLANPSQFFSSQTTVSISQLQKSIQEIYVVKVKELHEKLQSISDLTSNLNTLSYLKNQCHIWKKLEDLIKRQNKECYLQNRENLNQFLQMFITKMAKIQKRQLNKIETVIDKEHCSIRNIPQISKIYKDLKESFEKKIFTSSQQNFETFLQTLSICIHSKRRVLKNQFNHFQGDDISSSFMYNFEEFIELYQVLVGCITQDDTKKFNITFVEDMRIAIKKAIEKLDFLWSSSVQSIQRMIIERQFVKVNKMLNSLRYQKDFFENFQKVEIQRTRRTGQPMNNLINIKKYQQNIKILQQKRKYEQRNRDNFIENPFENQEHTNRIISLYNTQNQMARMKLRRKIREDFTRKLQAYKNIESYQGHQMYYQLQALIDKIPGDIVKDNNWINQVQKIKKDKQEQEKIQLKEISKIKLDNYAAKAELFNALNQNKSAKLVSQIIKKIKQVLSQTKAYIRQQKSVHLKINAFNQIITLFNNSCIRNVVNKDLSEIVKVFQKDVFVYFQDFIQQFFKVIISNLTAKTSSNKETEDRQYVKGGIELYYFAKAWQQQKFTEQLNIVVVHFRQFILTLVSQFRKVCPLRKILKQLDSSFFPIHSIREILNKIQIYQQIGKSIQKYQLRSKQVKSKVANNCEEMQEEQELNIQMEDESNTKNNSLLNMRQILDEIQQFSSQLKKRKENIKSNVIRFTFKDESLYHFTNKLNIKQKVQQLQTIFEKALNFSYFAQINPAYVITESQIQIQKEKYCQQFNEFVQQNIRGYMHFVETDESSLPQSFEYFQHLTYYLVQCKINFIKMHYRIDENAYIVNDNPYLKLNQIIKNLSNRYIRKIKVLEESIVQEKKLPFKQEIQNKLKELKKEKQADEAKLQQEKKQKRKEVEYSMFTATAKQIENQKQKIEKVFSKALDILTQKYLQKTNQLQSQVILKMSSCHQYLECLLKIVKIVQTTQSSELISSLKSRFLEFRQFVFKNKLQGVFEKYFEQKHKYILNLRKLMQMPKIQHLKSFQTKLNSRSSSQIIQRISKKSQDYISDRDYLAEQVRQFEREFKKIKTNLITKNRQIKYLVNQVNLKNKVQTLATIAAIWSISKSLTKQKSEYIWQAKLHHVEILSLLLLTCRQEDEDQTTNNQTSLFNVKSGQGKSLIIAILATYYALNCFNVNVACYTSQISKQTQKRYAFLFQSFYVTDRIQYESFHEICQKKLLASFSTNLTQILLTQQKKKGFFNSFKELGKKLFTWPSKQRANSKEILLLDEVDMLWDPDHLNRCLTPIIKLPLPEFIKIVKHVWDLIKDEKFPEPEQIYKLEEYQILKNRYPNLKEILQSSIKLLLTVFQNQPRDSYNVYQKEIYYRNKENSLTPVNFGFQTMLIYCRQYQAKNLSLQNLQKQLYLPINVGDFSYTETAKYFDIIQGVSSGLQVIQQNKKQFLSKYYRIPPSSMYLMPSIYEQAEQETILKYTLSDHTSLFSTIRKCILQTQNWPLLICFKNYKCLKNFQESSQFKSLCRKYNTLHYMKKTTEKEKIVYGAGQKDAMTLVTADSMWGLNIEIAPDVIDSKGNLHLIIAYIPESQGELQQLKGRTGRMGQYGLINFIFNQDEFQIKLKYLGLKIKLPQNSDKVEQSLKDYYNIKDSKIINPKVSRVVLMEERHQNNIAKYQSNNSKTSLQQLIHSNNFSNFKTKNYNISIAIQGTQSMKDVFLIIKNNISNIFIQINHLRAKMKIKQTASLSFMIYSNYNRLGETVMQTSDQFQTPDRLALFLKQKQLELQQDQPSAALELVLRLITLQKKSDMLLIIGSSKPNNQQEIENYMKTDGWKNYVLQKQFCTIEEELQAKRTLQSQAALANRNLVINGLTITRGEDLSSNQLFKILKQLSEDFRGEAKQVDISKKEQAQLKIIKSIVTNTVYVLNGCKLKEQIQKLYDMCRKENL